MNKFNNPESEFEFAVDAYLTKSTGEKIEKEDELDFDNMWIQGIAADDQKDLEGETLNPKTFFTDYFLQVGKITFEHKSNENPLAAIGEPRETKITPNNEFYVKGILYKSSELAKQVYKQTYILQSDKNSTRRMQWSIEGKKIIKNNLPVGIFITHVTLTQNPINYKNTFAEVVKKAMSPEFIPEVENNFELDPLREAELMVYLHSKDDTIFCDLKKAINYCKILDHCSKHKKCYDFFEKNTIEKLDQFLNLDDMKKSIEYCDIAFHIFENYPASIDFFERTNIIEFCNKVVQ